MERFFFKHRNKGIQNLMLYIVIASGIVTIMSIAGTPQIYNMLVFDRAQILKGQVWRLFTWPLTNTTGSASGLFMDLILLYCYYSLGRAIEAQWGTFRFNLYYLGGIVLMDIFAMALGGITVTDTAANIRYDFSAIYSGNMALFLHLSLLISFATLYPDAQFYILFIIPIRAWIMALIYLIIILVQVIQLSVPLFCFPHNLFPLVAMLNYFLFFGKDVVNVLPPSWRRNRRPRQQYAPRQTTIRVEHQPRPKQQQPYIHRCTICGRTDVSNPELEFRYCSRCNGYFCYCEDHISNHEHVE